MKINALIAIDLDGTLLSSSYTISPFTIGTIKRLSAAGAAVILASGRPLRSILPYYRLLDLNTPLVAYNGMLSFHPRDASFPRFERRLPESFLRGLISKHRPYLKNLYLEADDSHHYLARKDEILPSFFPDADKNGGNTFESLVSSGPVIAIFDVLESDRRAFCEDIDDFDPYMARPWTGLPYIEIAIKDADKGNAVGRLMKELGYRRECVYAYGDADNDVSLLSLAKEGYAIGSTKSDLLKKLFPLTEKGNDEDGVAHSLRQAFKLD